MRGHEFQFKNQKRLQAGQFDLDISRPLVMGIVNVTPDSFYDGGRFLKVKAAVDKAAQLVAEGADIIDIGGESSRPGALPVQYDEEKRRIMPVLQGDTAIQCSDFRRYL